MRFPTYETFAQAYRGSIQEVIEGGDLVPGIEDSTSVGSEFGLAKRPTLELRPFGFRVLDPHACLVWCDARQPSLPYAIGQWLWTMRGSDELESIAYYNGRGRVFSDNGHRLSGAAGPRLRG